MKAVEVDVRGVGRPVALEGFGAQFKQAGLALLSAPSRTKPHRAAPGDAFRSSVWDEASCSKSAASEAEAATGLIARRIGSVGTVLIESGRLRAGVHWRNGGACKRVGRTVPRRN